MWNHAILWFKIIRPGTLSAAISPVLIGLMVANEVASINWTIAIATIVAATAIQIASNLINDYYDFKKGLDEPGRLGPRRALAENRISLKAMQIAICIDLAICLLTGAYLIYIGGLPILLIGITAILFAWLYTATSYSLSYLGIADIFVLIYFGPVATVGTTYLQTGHFSSKSFWLGLICGFISMAVLTVNNLRDRDSDAKAGKRSLIVRLGKKFGDTEYLVLYLLMIPCLLLANTHWFAYGIILVGALLYLKLRKTVGREYNKMLVFTGLSNIIFVILYYVGILLS